LRNPFPAISIAPPEVYPSHRATLQINLKALKEKPIFGTGPGTFLFDYTKFRNPEVNRTVFWNVRFPVGASKVTDSFGTTGILGAGSLLLFIGTLLFSILKPRSRDSSEVFLFGTIGVGTIASISSFFFSWNTISLFLLFWLFIALGTIISRDLVKERKVLLAPQVDMPESAFIPWLSAVFSFAFVAVIIFGAGLLYFSGMRFFAELAYQDAVQEFSQGNLQRAQERIARALQLNQNQDIYWRDFAQIQLVRFRQEASRTDVPVEQIRQTITSLVGSAVDSAKMATEIEPKNVANWIVRGVIYQDLIGSVGEAENAALNLGYEKARELDPANPYIITQIGRVYLQKVVLAQQQGQTDIISENLNKAEEQFKRAIELKGDFAPAHFQLAVLAQMKGDIPGTISKLQETKLYVTNMPDLIGLSFQLGVLYYQRGEYGPAKTELEFAVSQNPDYSNARYFLGLIYDREGKKTEAIQQFEIIEKFNPDNQQVKKILDNLRVGRPALEGILQEQPPRTPVEEGKPKEVK